MAFVPYVTLDELRNWAQVPGLDKADQMELAIDAASRAIDEHCNRHFWQDGTLASPVARKFVTTSRCELWFDRFNDLTTVAVPVVETDEDGDGTFETAWAATDFQVLPATPRPGWPYTSILATASRRFPCPTSGRVDRVRVTGVWGWVAVPSEVKQATLIKATRLFTRMQSPNGIAGVDAFGPVRVNRAEDGDVVTLLEPYRHLSALVGFA